MSNTADAKLTAKISTFSETVGGAAFASNWLLQQTFNRDENRFFPQSERD